jgi:hypothetical protein
VRLTTIGDFPRPIPHPAGVPSADSGGSAPREWTRPKRVNAAKHAPTAIPQHSLDLLHWAAA